MTGTGERVEREARFYGLLVAERENARILEAMIRRPEFRDYAAETVRAIGAALAQSHARIAELEGILAALESHR